jgi:DNA-directed RNA polymerase subunit K/omega
MPPKKMPPNKPKNITTLNKRSKDDYSESSSDSYSSDDVLSGSGSDTESDSDSNVSHDDRNTKQLEKHDEIDDDDALGEEDDDDDDDDGEDEEEQEEQEEEQDDQVDADCVYKYSKKKSAELDEEEDGDEDYFLDEEDITKNDDNLYVSNDKRITKPVMTKYERVRILGERARQISLGAKPMVKGLINMDPKEIARIELKMKVIPMKIIRTLPTGEKEKWKISELTVVN